MQRSLVGSEMCIRDRPMAQGPSAHGPGPIGPKGPLGSPGETPLGCQGTPPGIPRDLLKSLFFKNRFFKKISVMLHQWVFYRTYPYDNTIFDNDFSPFFMIYLYPLMYRSGAIFMKIDYFSRKTTCFLTNIGVFPRTRILSTRSLCCLLYTSPSPRDYAASRMPSSA